MDRDAFITYLVRSDHTETASKARADWCQRVEDRLLVDVSEAVSDKAGVLDLVERIMAKPAFTSRQHRNFPNAIRHYYLFATGKRLGTLRENDRR